MNNCLDEKIKEKGDKILKSTRNAIRKASNSDEDALYLINRWIYQRLQLDEREKSKKTKRELFEESPKCKDCLKEFGSIKNTHIHKENQIRGYHRDNCVLLCKACHDNRHYKKKMISK